MRRTRLLLGLGTVAAATTLFAVACGGTPQQPELSSGWRD